MSGIRGLHPNLRGFSGRSTLPLLDVHKDAPEGRVMMRALTDARPDPRNVSGDIYLRFPKELEAFMFFVITDVARFKTALKSYKPTTAADVSALLEKIAQSRQASPTGRSSVPDAPLTQVAFARLGMHALGITEGTGDARFDTRPMLQDRAYLGDSGVWDDVFDKGKLHGVFIVCAKGSTAYTQGMNDIKNLFGSSITIKDTKEGNVRPGVHRGKEHFGFQDGISEPSLRNLTVTKPGQLEVDPGVILMGYKGDPVPNRPAWTQDGSMMIFRKLEQDVGPFNDYIKLNGKKWRDFTPIPDQFQPPLSDQEGEEFFAATIIGRWKSGTPLMKAPFRDDPAIQTDPETTNDFDYTIPGVFGPTDRFCPFAAHARKTNPRNLDPYVDKAFLESAAISRAAVPYGSDYSEATKDELRGLHFVCYQSSLDNGFFMQTKQMMTNDFFPTTSLLPIKHGQDPITGGPPPAIPVLEGLTLDATTIGSSGRVVLRANKKDSDEKYEITGFAEKLNTSADAFDQQYFVTSRGGEYFFVPSVSTLKAWAETASPPTQRQTLDLLILQDATGSQQPYIDAARDAVTSIYDELLRAGSWARDEIRVGIIAFKDHPGKTTFDYVTRPFPFTSSMSEVVQNMQGIAPSGGGDGPEAQCDALADAVLADWAENSIKVVVMITDSPPHGIGESGDQLPGGCPDQNDPVALTEIMANKGIRLFVLGCEPTLSELNATAKDFYTGRKTL